MVSFAVTGLTSGDLGLALRAGLTTFATAMAFQAVGGLTGNFAGADPNFGGHGPLEPWSDAHLFNIAGHALVGCGSAVASGGRCGAGALSAGIGSLVGPFMRGQSFEFRLVANAVLGGLTSAAAGGNFGNGALMAAFGYLFNEVGLACRPAGSSMMPGRHCGLFVFEGSDPRTATILAQFSLGGGATQFNTDFGVMQEDWEAFRSGEVYISGRPPGMSQADYDSAVIALARSYEATGYFFHPDLADIPNSNAAAAFPIHVLGGSLPWIGAPGAPGLNYYSYLRPSPPPHQFLK